MNCVKDSRHLIINRFIQLYEVGSFFDADEEFKIDIDYVEYIKRDERLIHAYGIKADWLVRENLSMIEHMNDFRKRWQATGIDPLINPPINSLFSDPTNFVPIPPEPITPLPNVIPPERQYHG